MFDETLAELTARIDGARAIVLTGVDGMILAAAGGGGADPAPDLLAACLSDVHRRVVAAHRDAGLPLPVETSAGSSDATVVVRRVTDEYLLVALLGPAGGLGRARFEMRRAAARLQTELL